MPKQKARLVVMKVLVKAPGKDAVVKDMPQDVVKSAKKIIKPGKFFGLLFNDVTNTEVAALASDGEKVVVYSKKKPSLKNDAYNFELQKSPLISFYGSVMFVRIKDSSSETVDAVDLTDADIKAIGRFFK